jgi:hypothetical protein
VSTDAAAEEQHPPNSGPEPGRCATSPKVVESAPARSEDAVPKSGRDALSEEPRLSSLEPSRNTIPEELMVSINAHGDPS